MRKIEGFDHLSGGALVMKEAELNAFISAGQEEPAAVFAEGGAAHGGTRFAIFAEIKGGEGEAVLNAPEGGEIVIS